MYIKEALEWLSIIKSKSCKPIFYTYTLLVDNFYKVGRLDGAKEIFSEAWNGIHRWGSHHNCIMENIQNNNSSNSYVLQSTNLAYSHHSPKQFPRFYIKMQAHL